MKRKALLLITGALVIAFVNRSLGSVATTQLRRTSRAPPRPLKTQQSSPTAAAGPTNSAQFIRSITPYETAKDTPTESR